MVGILLLDLGGTLVDGERPLPHVVEALKAIAELDGSTGAPLQIALVSDFYPADPPTPAGVQARFDEYLVILDRTGLRWLFEPVDRRVTLSTHAGVRKPDRRVYELALRRLGTSGGLTDCLSITENVDHVAACRALGMQALQFGVDFDDWSQAPALVRRMIDPAGSEEATFERSLRAHGQLAGADDDPLPPGATHREVYDEQGRKTIRRERFRAV
ncbi:HAD family hydrolase [Geodermatophilus sp. URMC 63]